MFGWIILGLAVLLALWLVVTYNRLVALRQTTGQAWSDVDVQLKQRHDLIPNLVETVKGYAAHERTTLDAVIQARNAAAHAQGPVAAGQAEGALGAALGRLFALSEAYPDLKARSARARPGCRSDHAVAGRHHPFRVRRRAPGALQRHAHVLGHRPGDQQHASFMLVTARS